MTVTEGPAIDFDNANPSPIVSWPFAYQLSLELDRLGVNSSYEHFEAGAKLGLPGYHQFHVVSEVLAKDLAIHIATRLGKFVVFGSLWMPPNGRGVMYAGAGRHQNFYVRRLIHYWAPTDEPVQRFDVLVKRAEVHQ